MRDIQKQPYSRDEKKVAKYIVDLFEGRVGAGDDPIQFLIASHNVLTLQRKELWKLTKELEEQSKSNLKTANNGSPVTSLAEDIGLGMVGVEQRRIGKKLESILEWDE